MSKMSALGLESLLGSYIVRYKGQSDWIIADLVKLSDGLHLEAMRLEAKFSPPKQVIACSRQILRLNQIPLGIWQSMCTLTELGAGTSAFVVYI